MKPLAFFHELKPAFRKAAVSATLLPLLALSPSAAQTDFGEVANAVAEAMNTKHFARHNFDDEYSLRTLNAYLDTLDGSHRFFLQSDIDQFRRDYGNQLDNQVLTEDISAAQVIYDVFTKRAEERVNRVLKMLKEEKFTFDTYENIEIDRRKAPWPKDMAEADDLWRRTVKEQILLERLTAKQKLDKAAEKAKEASKQETKPTTEDAKPLEGTSATEPTPTPVTSEPEETPEQKVAKRWENFRKSLSENDKEDVADFFISALTAAYDPHSEYMSMTEMDDFRTGMKTELVGIGAQLQKKDDVVEVQGIIPNGPADKSNALQPKDKIIGVAQGKDGKMIDVRDQKLQKIVQQIRGERNTIVRLLIIPSKTPGIKKEISIVREVVPLKDKIATANLIDALNSDGKTKRIGWIELHSFYADMDEGTTGCSKDVKRLLERLIKENIDGLVLDLRGNGGGSLDEAVNITGLFIKRGPVVQSLDWRREEPEARVSRATEPMYTGPLIVLTDKASASASEIVAAALQDTNRALIIGEESTFGKGTVQTILPLNKIMPIFKDTTRAGALKVTIQKFYRIAGGSTQLKGVVPDIQLPMNYFTEDMGEDTYDFPLTYDTIKPLRYQKFPSLPIENLSNKSKSRVAENQEFKYLNEDIQRYRERQKKNVLTLNEKERLAEIAENKERLKKRKEERKNRVEALKEAQDKTFTEYRLTLDNIDQPLKLDSAFTDEEKSGVRIAKDEDEEIDAEEKTKWPYNVHPIKHEVLNIMQDLIAHQESLQTAQTDTAPNQEARPQ